MRDNEWEKINVVFKLKSPLHIGYMPFKGSVVSPTRYYVPGRNLWGAITKRITEHLCKVPKAGDYRNISKQIMENFRFSYFYLYDGKTIYLPHYTDEGMKYGDNKKKITKAEFEHRFIGSIVSTGIDDKTKTAKDKSLHEMEFINSRYRDENGDIKAVKIAGCLWIKKNTKIEIKREEEEAHKFKIKPNGIFIDDFNIISELILGGESKYGFGHVLFDSIDKVNFPLEYTVEPKNQDENCKDEIKIKCGKDEPLLAHLKCDRKLKFEGEIELLTGRGYYDPNKLKDSKNEKQEFCMDGSSSENKNNSKDDVNPGKVISRPVYYFSPGTVLKKLKKKTDEKQEEQEESIICKLNWDGTLERCSNASN